MLHGELQKIMDEVIHNNPLDNLAPDQSSYIHQRLMDFAPFLTSDSTIKVHLEVTYKEPTQLTLEIVTFGVAIKSYAEGESFFEAAEKASSQLLDHLCQIKADMMGADRKQIIHNIVNKRKLH